jgi:hypothetical protein
VKLNTKLKLLLLCLAPLLLAACSAGQAELPPLAGALPDPASLDALRRPSEIESFRISLVQPHSQVNTAPLLDQRSLTPNANELAFAIFQVSAPEGSLDSLLALGTGKLYLLVADFGSGRWSLIKEFSAGEARIDLTPHSGLVSPAGYFYAAVLAPRSIHGGVQSTLSSLTLVHDENHTGNTYFVAPDSQGGSDLSPGTSALPWATLQHAADTVQAGDTVIVRPGNYEGFMLQSSGTPLAPITFSALDGARVIFDNPVTADGINIENWGVGAIHDVIIEGFTVTGCSRAGIRIVGGDPEAAQRVTIRRNICQGNGKWGILSGFADHLTVEYNQCSNSIDEHGIYLSNSGDFNIARGNVCFNNAASGIQFNADASLGGDGIMSQALIEGSVCFGNGAKGGAALNMDGLQDSIIRNNLLYDNHATGLVMYSGDGLASKNNRVLCNTIIQAATGRWCVTISNGSTGNVLENNILWSRHAFRGALDIDPSSMAGFISDYNLLIGRFTQDGGDNNLNLLEWQSLTGQDMHSVLMTDESFFHDLAADDYHIGADAPAVDIGTTHPDNPPADRDGVPRPQAAAIDAGCYEAQ